MSNILFITFILIFCSIILYLVYIYIGMKHVLKFYINTKQLMQSLPESYTPDNGKTLLHLYITKDIENWWKIGYKNESTLGLFVSCEKFHDALNKMINELKSNNYI